MSSTKLISRCSALLVTLLLSVGLTLGPASLSPLGAPVAEAKKGGKKPKKSRKAKKGKSPATVTVPASDARPPEGDSPPQGENPPGEEPADGETPPEGGSPPEDAPVEDSKAPETKITAGPDGQVDETSAEFAFEADQAGSEFMCRLDEGPWVDCEAPLAIDEVSEGSHTLEVFATDPAGNPDPTPAKRTWKVRSTAGEQLLFDDFGGSDGVISNHFIYWQRHDLSALRDGNWGVESGTLFRRDGVAWSGVPTCEFPDATSSQGGGSSILRAHLQKDLPTDDYKVEMRFRNNGFTNLCPDRPLQSYHGVKIYLRRSTSNLDFYTAEISLKDNKAYIQKKQGGEYEILAQKSGFSPRFGEWEDVGGSVKTNTDGSVTVQVIRNGRVVLETTDRSHVIKGGRTGFRADNTDFNVDDFRVTSM